jgi:hypothetical protein
MKITAPSTVAAVGDINETQPLYGRSEHAGAHSNGRGDQYDGNPLTPGLEQVQRILTGMEEYSKPIGTSMSLADNVGVIRIGADGQGIVK